MPVNLALKGLAKDGRFSLDDAKTLQSLVKQGKVSESEAKETLQRYGDVMDPEAGTLLEGFTGGSRGGAMQGLPGEVTGKTLRPGNNGGDVQTLQRGLMSLGMKEQNPAYTMPTGVDGMYGSETKKAVQAFQTARGIAATGTADPATLRALDSALKGERAAATTTPVAPVPTSNLPRPTRGLGGNAPATTPVQEAAPATGAASPQTVTAAAERLVNGPTSQNYGVKERWINNDPRHAAAVNKPINGTAERWKCNLFAGNVMAAAGFEPPYYGNRRTGGEYPNANQLYKWSDKYAAKNGNANNVRFEMKDEIRDLPNMTDAARQARIGQMLEKLQPGDMLIVDHKGTDVSDGGHCRVFLGKNDDGTYRFAQASQERAEIQNESAADIMNEEHAWILKPNTARKA